jgi:hypothetical protein
MLRAGWPIDSGDRRSALGSETTYYAREYGEGELKALSDAIPDLSLACDWLPVVLKTGTGAAPPYVCAHAREEVRLPEVARKLGAAAD